MIVFISCSGPLSHDIGKLLFDWLPEVNQGVKPFLYSEDIDKGALWPEEIDKALDTTVGILCVTQENKNAPWLLFEAGGLSKGVAKARVCPLLIDLEPQDVKQPLARFTFTLPNKEDMWQLLGTINRANPEKELREKLLRKSFDRLWSEFEKPFGKIREAHKKEAKPAQRGVEDMVVEILGLTRKLQGNFEEQRLLLTKPASRVIGSGYSGFDPSGSFVISKPPESGYKLYIDTNLISKKDDDITQQPGLESKFKELLSEFKRRLRGGSPKNPLANPLNGTDFVNVHAHVARRENTARDKAEHQFGSVMKLTNTAKAFASVKLLSWAANKTG